MPADDNLAGAMFGSVIENKTFDEINVGDAAMIVRILSKADIELFALLAGDLNPAHLDEQYAASDLFQHVIAHGILGNALYLCGTRHRTAGTGHDLSWTGFSL